jgi:uncharacterized membrane protein YkvI
MALIINHMETRQQHWHWHWYNYFGFLALVLLTLLVNMAALVSIAWNETTLGFYSRCFLSFLILLANLAIVGALWKNARNVAAAIAIGVAPPCLATIIAIILILVQSH